MNDSNSIFVTGPRPQISNMDALPFADRSLVDYEKYKQYIGHANVKYCMTLHTTRGCPFRCIYCHKIFLKKHVFRSAENIFEEVMLYYNLGIRRIAIQDDVFNYNRKNSSRFLELIIKHTREIQLFFETGLRGDILTRDYIDLLVEAGTVSLTLALETASPRLQKLIRKNLNLDKLRENIEYFCRQYPHVILGLQTMTGFPTETEKEAMMTLDFIKSIKWLHFPFIHILKIYPNTDMENLALKKGISREAIEQSRELAYHELPETLPFGKSFLFNCQVEYLHNYFLLKERFLHVLPFQLEVLTRDEMVQKYNSYIPIHLENFQSLLDYVGIKEEELKGVDYLDDDYMFVPGLNEKLKRIFPEKKPGKNALKILLLDLSLFFSSEPKILYDIVEPPLGLMLLLSYLNQEFGNKINGKIAKSRIDFDSYRELQAMVKKFKPDIIGIRSLSYYKDFFHRTTAMIRNMAFNGLVIAGGPYATSEYKNLLQDRNVDLVVLGEGEKTFTEVLKKIINHKGKLPDTGILKKIKGIAFIRRQTRPKEEKQKEEAYLFHDDLENECERYKNRLPT